MTDMEDGIDRWLSREENKRWLKGIIFGIAWGVLVILVFAYITWL